MKIVASATGAKKNLLGGTVSQPLDAACKLLAFRAASDSCRYALPGFSTCRCRKIFVADVMTDTENLTDCR